MNDIRPIIDAINATCNNINYDGVDAERMAAAEDLEMTRHYLENVKAEAEQIVEMTKGALDEITKANSAEES